MKSQQPRTRRGPLRWWSSLAGLMVSGIVVLGSHGSSAAAAGASGACTCQNMKELQYRIKEVNALIQGYKNEIGRIGQGPMFSLTAYKAFQSTQQAMLNRMKSAGPSVRTASGETDSASCNSHFPSSVSPCLLEALKAHEAHHETSCRLKKGKWPTPALATDYREGKPLAAAYQEEIDAYYIELTVLQEELNALPDSCKPPGWVLYYQVQIRGEGDQPRRGRDSQVSWKVDRSYSGTFELTRLSRVPKNPSALAKMTPQQLASMTPQQILNLQQQMTVQASKLWKFWMPNAPMVPTDVAVDDKMVLFEHEPGEADSFQDTTTTHTYQGAGQDNVQNCIFEEDPGGNTYNVTIGIGPNGQKGYFVVQESSEVNRSPYGWGGAPTHESNPLPAKRETFNILLIPTVKGLLDNATIHHAVDQPLKFIGGILQFDSGWVAANPLTPPFSSWPQADQKLKIRVYYKISKFQ